jgi:hypothetical protein
MDIKVSFRQDAKKTDYTDHIYKWCFLWTMCYDFRSWSSL